MHIKSARRTEVLRGRRISMAPFGLTRADGALRPNSDAKHIRTMFDLRDQGATHREIAEHLNHRGILAPRGGPWRRGAIRYLLRNRIYRGETVYEPWDEAEPVVLQTPSTAIVDVDVFDRVQTRRITPVRPHYPHRFPGPGKA